MLHRNNNILVYIAMADAYAAAAEYLKFPRDDRVLEECLKFRGYVQHPTHSLRPGKYTDDAEMSVANARVLLNADAPYSALQFADEYVREFRRGSGRDGYARGFQDFLETVRTGQEFLTKIKPISDKNGAAMRAVPFGVLPTIERVLEVATLQAKITHNTPDGIFSARAVALLSHGALYTNTPLNELGEFCLKHLLRDEFRAYSQVFRQSWSGGRVHSSPGVSVAVATVHAVVDAISTETSLMGILERILRWGGDTDSVAAIAWGIASARYQAEALPEFLERDLECGNPHTGVLCLRELGTCLMEKFSRPHQAA